MTVSACTYPIVVNNTFIVKTIKGHFHGFNRFDAVLERSNRYILPIRCVRRVRWKQCRGEFHTSNGGGGSGDDYMEDDFDDDVTLKDEELKRRGRLMARSVISTIHRNAVAATATVECTQRLIIINMSGLETVNYS